MIGIQPQLNEPLRVCGGFAVGAHVHDGIGVVHSRKTDRALHALQQHQVDAVALADLPCRNVRAVVADQMAGGQQQRRVGRPDFVGGDALLKQPLDQLGSLRARGAFQSAKQIVDVPRFFIDAVIHAGQRITLAGHYVGHYVGPDHTAAPGLPAGRR